MWSLFGGPNSRSLTKRNQKRVAVLRQGERPRLGDKPQALYFSLFFLHLHISCLYDFSPISTIFIFTHYCWCFRIVALIILLVQGFSVTYQCRFVFFLYSLWIIAIKASIFKACGSRFGKLDKPAPSL